MVPDFALDGICIRPSLVTIPEVLRLRALPGFAYGGRPGSRGFKQLQEIADLVGPGGTLNALAACLMDARAYAVRILHFDKTPAINWAVPWHRDRTIAVAARVEMPGYGPWSMKAGVHHVEPPGSILHAIVSLRLHLDDSCHDNGPCWRCAARFALDVCRLGR